MVHRSIGAAATAAIMLMLVQYCWAQPLAWENIGNGLTGLTEVCLVREESRILVGSKSGIYLSEDGGDHWKYVLRSGGRSAAVNRISSYGEQVYAANSSGLYRSDDSGMSWQRIYRCGSQYAERCVAVKSCGERIVLGTGLGLLVSPDRGNSWQKANGELSLEEISSLAQAAGDQKVLCAATASGLFVSIDAGLTWAKVHGRLDPGTEGETAEQTEAADEDNGDSPAVMRMVCFDPADDSALYAGFAGHIERSKDRGQTWQRLTDAGLTAKDIRHLGFFNGRLTAASGNSIFMFTGDRWEETGQRLAAGRISSFSVSGDGRLYAAAERGLFVSLRAGEGGSLDNSAVGRGQVPDIRSVQQAAIVYAEVQMGKIRDWRKKAAARAWLPSVAVGVDRDTTELWHWEGGSTTRSQDDELRRGKDALDWDVSLSWDLGDLVWSGDQTSIDTRSRLLVQLRNEILDDVNKLYFEYIRVSRELENLADSETGKIAEKKLRLAELAASLDGLTDHYFSTARPGLAVEK